MAEPTGFFVEVTLEEESVKKLLNHAFEYTEPKKKLEYYLSKLLYECNTEDNVFIFHYEHKSKKCFIGWFLNHFVGEELNYFYKIFPILSTLQQTNTMGYATVASTCDIFEIYKITAKDVEKLPLTEAHQKSISPIIEKLWTFTEADNTFARPDKALRKRNYFHKNFKNYYKKYLTYQDEIQKPKKIAQATRENPFHLFNRFYTYDKKVYDLGIMYQFFQTLDKVVLVPHADPLTFRAEADMIADKNYVFAKYLAPNSPPKTIKNEFGSMINNPDVIWEYKIVEGIDGASFTYLGNNKWEVVYYKDKNSVFIKGLKKVKDADITTFSYLDFCYGRDKNHIFYLDKIMPIDPHHYTLTKHGFIFDKKHVFHYERKLPLDGVSFEVLQYESETNPFKGKFVLGDKSGKYEYDSQAKKECIKPI